MSDPWARPTDGRRSAPADDIIEIELDGPGWEPRRQSDPEPAAEPNWRKVVALSSVAGVLIGLAVAAVILMGGDEGDGAPDTDGPDEAVDGSTITAPPTLPPATVPGVDEPAVLAGSPDLPIELPSFQEAALPSDLLDDFVLDAETIAADPAARVTIEVSTGDGLGPTIATVEYDESTERYLTTLDLHGPIQRLLIDPQGGGVYVMERGRDTGEWDFVRGVRTARSAAASTRDLLLSPVRPETLASAATSAETGVVLDSGTIARRYRVTMPAIAIPEWTTGGEAPAAPGIDHVFEAYVDERGRLALVQGTVVVDGVRQLIVYRFDNNADVSIELPEQLPDA